GDRAYRTGSLGPMFPGLSERRAPSDLRRHHRRRSQAGSQVSVLPSVDAERLIYGNQSRAPGISSADRTGKAEAGRGPGLPVTRGACGAGTTLESESVRKGGAGSPITGSQPMLGNFGEERTRCQM